MKLSLCTLALAFGAVNAAYDGDIVQYWYV